MAVSPSQIDEVFQRHMSTVAASMQLAPQVAVAAGLAVDCLRRGGKILACGNGGSAADAQHLACELVGRFLKERPAMAAIALHADTSTLTAVANDYGFERVFARQVEALAQPGDVLFAFSTSGNSANVLAAAESARRLQARVVALTGQEGGSLGQIAELCLKVPSLSTPRIQEVHGLIVHALCEAVEAELEG